MLEAFEKSKAALTMLGVNAAEDFCDYLCALCLKIDAQGCGKSKMVTLLEVLQLRLIFAGVMG